MTFCLENDLRMFGTNEDFKEHTLLSFSPLITSSSRYPTLREKQDIYIDNKQNLSTNPAFYGPSLFKTMINGI